jgi:hypothetical protein
MDTTQHTWRLEVLKFFQTRGGAQFIHVVQIQMKRIADALTKIGDELEKERLRREKADDDS